MLCVMFLDRRMETEQDRMSCSVSMMMVMELLLSRCDRVVILPRQVSGGDRTHAESQ
jgi:hypothetical protein